MFYSENGEIATDELNQSEFSDSLSASNYREKIV